LAKKSFGSIGVCTRVRASVEAGCSSIAASASYADGELRAPCWRLGIYLSDLHVRRYKPHTKAEGIAGKPQERSWQPEGAK